MSAAPFTYAEVDWDTYQPGESSTGKCIRAMFASIAVCLDESGCPLTDEQTAVLRDSLVSLNPPAG